jgi:hypothetical protein
VEVDIWGETVEVERDLTSFWGPTIFKGKGEKSHKGNKEKSLTLPGHCDKSLIKKINFLEAEQMNSGKVWTGSAQYIGKIDGSGNINGNIWWN